MIVAIIILKTAILFIEYYLILMKTLDFFQAILPISNSYSPPFCCNIYIQSFLLTFFYIYSYVKQERDYIKSEKVLYLFNNTL